MERFQKTFIKWRTLNSSLYNDCKMYLIKVLTESPNHTISFEDADGSVCVSYDGGGHPEYASNCYSEVLAVYMKDNNVYLDTEDTPEYSIDTISADELHDVACFTHAYLTSNN